MVRKKLGWCRSIRYSLLIIVVQKIAALLIFISQVPCYIYRFSNIVGAIETYILGFLGFQVSIHLGQRLKSLRQMPDVERMLPCQLIMVSIQIVFMNVFLVLLAWVLEAFQGPFALQMCFLSAKVPKERQVVRKVTDQLLVLVELGSTSQKFRRVWIFQSVYITV